MRKRRLPDAPFDTYDEALEFEFEKARATIPPLTPEELARDRFEEINAFIDAAGHPPRRSTEPDADPIETMMAMRLGSFRSNAVLSAALASLDRHRLLAGVATRFATMEEALAYVDPEEAAKDRVGIFDLRRTRRGREVPDLVAERTQCRDFARYEGIFAACAAALKEGNAKPVPFTGESDIEAGDAFILNGQTVYVVSKGYGQVRTQRKYLDARLHCVVDNGMEYTPLLRSLSRALRKDATSRRIVASGGVRNPRTGTRKSRTGKGRRAT